MIVCTRPGNLAAQAVGKKLGLARAVDLDDHLLTYVSRWNGLKAGAGLISGLARLGAFVSL